MDESLNSSWASATLICAGIAALLIAILGKNFRNADILTASVDLGPSSTWTGKLVFAIVGTAFLAAGLYSLFK